jgi:hypothetical protein
MVPETRLTPCRRPPIASLAVRIGPAFLAATAGCERVAQLVEQRTFNL